MYIVYIYVVTIIDRPVNTLIYNYTRYQHQKLDLLTSQVLNGLSYSIQMFLLHKAMLCSYVMA
jgi:hypothetical protein